MTLRLIMSFFTILSARNLVSAKFGKPPLDTVNWTSCEEFLNNTKLNIDRLLDIEWKIFFFWSPEPEKSYTIKFSRPSSVLVDRFRVELDKKLEPTANWSNAELFMETTVDFNALLLKTPTPGIYRVIPTIAFECVLCARYSPLKVKTLFRNADMVQMPLMMFGFKLVEPGILGIANCRYRLCYALAPVYNMPHHRELEKVARTLNFYNPYNRTHIAYSLRQPTNIPYSEKYAETVIALDEDHDEDLEAEQDLTRMDFF